MVFLLYQSAQCYWRREIHRATGETPPYIKQNQYQYELEAIRLYCVLSAHRAAPVTRALLAKVLSAETSQQNSSGEI